MAIEKFPFDSLKDFKQEELRVNNFISRHLPHKRSQFIELIQASIQRYLKSDFSLQYESFFESSFEDYQKSLTEDSFFVSINCRPSTSKIFLELDKSMASLFVQEILGEDQSRSQLTKMDQLVLKFLCLKLMKISDHFFKFSSMQPAFDCFANSSQELKHLAIDSNIYFLITFRLEYAGQNSFLRFCIPKVLIEQFENEAFFRSNHEKEKAYRKGRLRNFDHFRFVLWGEVGRVDLKASDIQNLEKGDVIFFDESSVDYNGDLLSGDMTLRLGAGDKGGFLSKLEEKEACWVFKLESSFTE